MNQAGKTALPCNALSRFTFIFSCLRRSVISLSSCSWSVGKENNIKSPSKHRDKSKCIDQTNIWLKKALTFKDHGSGTSLRELDEHISKTHLHII